MLNRYFKNKFGKGDKEVAANAKFYSPLRIALHTTINIPTVDWLLMQNELNETMVLPDGDFTVNAIGTLENGKNSIYHVYMSDAKDQEFILQLPCSTKDGKETVDEATLYKQVVQIEPQTDAEWEVNLDAIGWESIELDDNTYNRVWSDNIRGKADFAVFKEKTVESDNEDVYTNNYMLYERKFDSVIGNEESEMLLVGVEETEETAEIVMMLGLTVQVSNIKIQ